jgi:hypothetical protein
MSTPKKSVTTVREELRTFSDAVDGTPLDGLDKWLTPEFWTTAVTAAGNIVAVLALIGWLDYSHVESVTKAITALIGASQVILINGLLIWKYLAGRQEIQKQIVAAKLRVADDIVVARIHALRVR